MKIAKIKIERFRSINSLEMEVSQDNNMIAICGKNNVGKTNFLRALNIFFNPEQYDKTLDMTTLKQATGGGTTHPKITVIFFDDEKGWYHEIIRDLNNSEENEGLSGRYYELVGKRKKNTVKYAKLEEIKPIIEKFEFVYIESINVIVPELIRDISDDAIDARYDKQRFTQSKKSLKESYDKYVNGLSEVLDSFANAISETFREFQPSWSVKFNVPKSSDTFRELISKDVVLQLDDSGSIGIEDKGAGLQRLAAILLQFEVLSRKTNKSGKYNIVCIDEPDVYIHEGLQRKLKDFLDTKLDNTQIFLTTHSKVFINQYKMKNVFLFDASHRQQYSERKKKNINVVETNVVDINTEDGYKKICAHLGIEILKHEILEENNLIVEGECDKKYITELGKFFGVKIPNIIFTGGASKILNHLDFYNSYYNGSTVKPNVKVLFDNDSAGRESFNKLNVSRYRNINVTKLKVKNFQGTEYTPEEEKRVNIEIEDLLYPELVVKLLNRILAGKKMNLLDENQISLKISKPAFRDAGILVLCDNEKNTLNMDRGNEISISGGESNVKNSMGSMFSLEANMDMIALVDSCDKKYPFVRDAITELLDFSKM